MVGKLEKLKLVIYEDRIINTNNPFGDKGRDYICKNNFVFEKGKIYGIVCEYGGGGEAVSLLLTNEVPLKQEKVFIDDSEANPADIEMLGWYVGKKICRNFIIKKEMSVRQLLENAIKKYNRYEKMEDIIEEFHLSPDKLHYGLSRNCEWQMWRASLAVGYASNKKIFCFPWMNTLYFYDCMYNSSVYRFFKKLKNEGSIIILPTSREKNVQGFVDEVIRINNPRFEHIISENSYFKEFF